MGEGWVTVVNNKDTGNWGITTISYITPEKGGGVYKSWENTTYDCILGEKRGCDSENKHRHGWVQLGWKICMGGGGWYGAITLGYESWENTEYACILGR